MTVADNVIHCDHYGCRVSEELDVPLDTFIPSANGAYEVRRWFADLGWRTVDTGSHKKMADLCPRHVEVQRDL